MSVDGTQTTDILLEDQCSRVTTYLGSLPASQAVVNDIEQLRKSIDEINSLFNEVMCALQTFDHKHFQSPTATGVELAPRWAEFRTVRLVLQCTDKLIPSRDDYYSSSTSRSIIAAKAPQPHPESCIVLISSLFARKTC